MIVAIITRIFLNSHNGNQCFSWSLNLHVYCHDFVPLKDSQEAH